MRLGHANMDLLNKLSTEQLVKGLPSVTFQKDKVCDACQFGKQIKSSFKSKKIISTSRPLELLHLDLFGPMRTASLGGKFYVFVIVDDFSRFTWTLFLTHKNKALQTFSNICKRIQNEKVFQLFQLEVIMEKNLKIRTLKYIVYKMVLNIIFRHLEPLNKMV